MIKIYIISLILITPLFFLEKKINKNLKMGYIFFVFLLIMGFRDNATISILNFRQSDEYSYRMAFNRLINSPINFKNIKSLEIGNYLLTWTMANIFKNSQSWIFLYSAITNYLFLNFIKKYVKPFWLGVFLYITIGVYTFQINAIRSVLAASILTLVVNPFINKKTIKVLIIVLLATSFHFSSIVLLLFYLYKNTNFMRKGIIFWLGISLLVMLKFKEITNFILIRTPYYYYIYQINNKSYGVNGYRVFLFTVIYVLILYFYKKLKIKTKEDIFFEKGIKILLFLNIVSLAYVYVHRFNDLFYFALIYSIPRLLSLTKKDNRRRLTILIIFGFFIFGLQQNYNVLYENILFKQFLY